MIDPLVENFLRGDHGRIDANLPRLLRALNDRGAAECWHKRGTFIEHLMGVYRMLALWRQPEDVKKLGLFHSVYATEFADLPLFSAGERATVRALVGENAEEMSWTFCRMNRRDLLQRILALDESPTGGLRLAVAGEEILLPAHRIGEFVVVTMADLMEQWSSWQDVVMRDFPALAPDPPEPLWSACLWPGVFRPSGAIMPVVSRLARHLEPLGIARPPVFEHGRRTISPQAASLAANDYWCVTATDRPWSEKDTRECLHRSIAENPWVAEPRLCLAQIELSSGHFEEAAVLARAGLQLLCDWGTSWDKRITWEGWIAWARVLEESAAARRWPTSVPLHNNLGFVETRRAPVLGESER